MLKTCVLAATLFCAACHSPLPTGVESVPLPGDWTLVSVTNPPAAIDSPLPFDFGGTLCIRSEQMQIDEQGRYSRRLKYSSYTCQDAEQVLARSGQWTTGATSYEFAPDQLPCAHPPASAKVTGNLLRVDWFEWSPSRGNDCYYFTWTFTYQKNARRALVADRALVGWLRPMR
jgi:hypothetical protein